MKLSKLLTVAALVGLLASSPAKAALIVTLGPTSTGAAGASLGPNINLTTTGISGNNYGVFDFGIPTVDTIPSGSLYDGNFLAVFKNGLASVSLTQPGQEFGFTWGTIENFNTVTVTDALNNSFAFTGTQALLLAITAGLPVGYGQQLDVAFYDPYAKIVSAVFSSTGNSFEVANLSAVPLPSTLVLFGFGLMAMACLSYRKLRA